MKIGVLRIGTRGSRLARFQADWTKARLGELFPELSIEIVEIKTLGDRDRNSPLAEIGGSGVFTKEVQRGCLSDDVDLAVHSLKDLPTENAPGLILAAIPPREDPFDALISKKGLRFADLPAGARIGTGSSRRKHQLECLRPDLVIESVRGNVETRLALAETGLFDGVVLAMAGLIRLELKSHVSERLEYPEFLPAVGQGGSDSSAGRTIQRRERSSRGWTIRHRDRGHSRADALIRACGRLHDSTGGLGSRRVRRSGHKRSVVPGRRRVPQDRRGAGRSRASRGIGLGGREKAQEGGSLSRCENSPDSSNSASSRVSSQALFQSLSSPAQTGTTAQ